MAGTEAGHDETYHVVGQIRRSAISRFFHLDLQVLHDLRRIEADFPEFTCALALAFANASSSSQTAVVTTLLPLAPSVFS